MELWVHGKSIDLLKVAHNYEERGHKVLLLTAGIDDRYSKGKITTRIGVSRDAITFEKNTNLYDLCLKNEYIPACILVDECQFLSKNQVDQLSDIVDYLHIPIICYGLKTDFRTEVFEGSLRLLEIADSLEEIKTICECGSKAIYNARFVDGRITTEGDKILIGDLEYKSLCRKCYKEKLEIERKRNLENE